MTKPFADQHPWYKPKLMSAATVFGVGSIALFSGFLTGGEWVTISTLTMATFATASVVENKAILESQ
jgi:hypothetical protein